MSRTAFRVAVRRATHQVLDHPPVFDDPLALRIIGKDAARDARTKTSENPFSTAARAFMAVRSRIAEDALAAAVARGVGQYVVLGAGLDTFAYRNAFASRGLRVFEVDHPATQAWKRQCLADASIIVPRSTTFAPIDFERETIARGLEAAGFDTTRPAFFSWLGVTMYLSVEAVAATLRYVGGLSAPTGIVFDYGVRHPDLSTMEKMALAALSVRVATVGEPFTSFFDPTTIAALLADAGLEVVEDLDKRAMNERYFANRRDGLAIRGGLGRVVVARVRG